MSDSPSLLQTDEEEPPWRGHIPYIDVLQDGLLTVAEVAEVLKLSEQTVRNWITHVDLPALRLGRRIRILRSDLGAAPRAEPIGRLA